MQMFSSQKVPLSPLFRPPPFAPNCEHMQTVFGFWLGYLGLQPANRRTPGPLAIVRPVCHRLLLKMKQGDLGIHVQLPSNSSRCLCHIQSLATAVPLHRESVRMHLAGPKVPNTDLVCQVLCRSVKKCPEKNAETLAMCR
jgi:hypothetical protein